MTRREVHISRAITALFCAALLISEPSWSLYTLKSVKTIRRQSPPFCGGAGAVSLGGRIPDAWRLVSTPPALVNCAAHGFTSRGLPRPLLIDAFPLSYETNVLLLRLLEIGDTVDAFVIIESDTTHSGVPRNLTFPELAPCLGRWRNKIFHSVLRAAKLPVEFHALSPHERAWAIENLQRNSLAEAAALAASSLKSSGRVIRNADVFVAVSDLDEIPRPEAYAAAVSCEGYREPAALTLDSFFYYDFRWRKQKPWHLGPRIFKLNETSGKFIGRFVPHDARNVDAVPPSSEHVFIRGGWHASYFLGTEGISRKIKSVAPHFTDAEIIHFSDLSWIEEKIDEGRDLFDRGPQEAVEAINCSDTNADIPLAAKQNSGTLKLFCPTSNRII